MIFAEYIQEKIKKRNFIRFDTFIAGKMGYMLTKNEETDERRKLALKEFRKRTGRKNIATMPTIRRWFGINGYTKPSRDAVYEMCFAMGLNKEETEEYLIKGLGQPAFQVNDYREMIFLYGLENGIDYDTCILMMQKFETRLDIGFSTIKTHSTRELIKQYELRKNTDADSFLMWMCDNAEWFKGYSQTVLDYLLIYKHRVIDGIRRDEEKQMNMLLSETGYYRWVASRKDITDPNSRKSIEKFIMSHRNSYSYNVSESLGNSILELAKDVYSDKITNSRLVSEVFTASNAKNDIGRKVHLDFIKPVTEKYLSYLYRIPSSWEISLRIAWGIGALNELSDGEEPPKWVTELLKEIYLRPIKVNTVSDAKIILRQCDIDNKRRCLMIQREDLLPLIHTVAQQRYMAEHENSYCADTAKQLFCDMANSTLNACNMPMLNEKYEIDYVLMECYTEEEMYSYSDLLGVWDEE